MAIPYRRAIDSGFEKIVLVLTRQKGYRKLYTRALCCTLTRGIFGITRISSARCAKFRRGTTASSARSTGSRRRGASCDPPAEAR